MTVISRLQKLEIDRTKALQDAKWPRAHTTITSLTGPKQMWIFSRYDTLGEMAQDLERLEKTPALKQELNRLDEAEGPLVDSRRDITVTYKPNISYRPSFDWTQIGYWEIIWIQTQQGRQGEYVENRVMTREEHDSGGFDTHQMMYAVQSGQQSGTFFVIRPMKTLALLDELHAANDGEPLTDGDRKWKIKLHHESTVSEEEAYFRTEPQMTYTP